MPAHPTPFSEALRTMRRAHFKTQGEFGDAAGYTDAAVCLWERGTNRPKASALDNIVTTFERKGVSADQLASLRAAWAQSPGREKTAA